VPSEGIVQDRAGRKGKSKASERRSMRFQGKVALITAAASGIGRATANIIGREGGRIAAVDIDRERLDATVAEITAAGGEAHAYHADALDVGKVDDVVADAAKRFGRIDILVNAVGGSTIIAKPAATTEELTLAEWTALIHFNLTGTFLFTHAVIPVMKRQKSGKIVNLASIAGRGKSSASSSAYATAKGGIIALTTKLANELGPYGINVNAIAPATTLTERIRPRWEQRPPEERQADIDKTPLRRMGEAVDQANVICFLASAHADFVTGLTIDVTGGL
jgi:NAD(P)-dependent dehydrogenase (short-subunit alcohol dehydrogenase family)